MKKNLNIIQIKGVKGLIFAGFVVTCLAAGFIAFPAWVCMQLWNIVASYTTSIPSIGIFQGLFTHTITRSLLRTKYETIKIPQSKRP